MKNVLELELPVVKELDRNELNEIEGGNPLTAFAGFIGTALLGAAAVEVIIDGSAQCWEDFNEGYQSTQQ